jgi:Hint domain
MRPALRSTLTIAAVAALLVACRGAGPGVSVTPSPASGSIGTSPSPSESPAAPVTEAELKVRLIGELGPLWYCDPDYYPIAREDEQRQAIERFEEIRADESAFAAIVAQLDLGDGPYSDRQKLAIYRLWKQLNAIRLEPAGGGRLAFDLLFLETKRPETGFHAAGTIDQSGTIEVAVREPAGPPNCPICLAMGTQIATPAGPRPIEALRPGDAIWTLDDVGKRVRGRILETGSMLAPPDHQVVKLRLADGRELSVSPGHPLADGRAVGELRAGDRVDGARVVSVRRDRYRGAATFDVLASGPTGSYWASGILLDSTLAGSR